MRFYRTTTLGYQYYIKADDEIIVHNSANFMLYKELIEIYKERGYKHVWIDKVERATMSVKMRSRY